MMCPKRVPARKTVPGAKKPITGASPISGAANSSQSSLQDEIFFYDAGCSYCKKSAEWLSSHAHKSLKLQPLSASQLKNSDSAQFLRKTSRSEHTYSGHFAIAEALRKSPYRYCRWISAGIRFKPFSPVARLVYRLVARNRHKIS